MRVLITFIGGASSIEGDTPEHIETMEKINRVLNDTENEQFIILNKTPYGDVIVNKSSISYIRRKQ